MTNEAQFPFIATPLQQGRLTLDVKPSVPSWLGSIGLGPGFRNEEIGKMSKSKWSNWSDASDKLTPVTGSEDETGAIKSEWFDTSSESDDASSIVDSNATSESGTEDDLDSIGDQRKVMQNELGAMEAERPAIRSEWFDTSSGSDDTTSIIDPRTSDLPVRDDVISWLEMVAMVPVRAHDRRQSEWNSVASDEAAARPPSLFPVRKREPMPRVPRVTLGPRPRPPETKPDNATALTSSYALGKAVGQTGQGTVDTTKMPAPIVPVAFPLPKELTSQYWTENRGSLAKFAGKTGMGEALRKLDRLHAAVRWDILYARKPEPFILGEWDRWYDSAKEELMPAAVFYARVDRVHALAEKVRKQIRYPASERLLCERIVLETKNIKDQEITIDDLVKKYEGVIKPYETTLSALHSDIPGKVETCLNRLLVVKNEEDWASGEGIMGLSRGITQFIGNAKKLSDKGYKVLVDVEECVNFVKRLTPYASKELPSLIDGRGFDFHYNALREILLDMKQASISAR